MYGGRTWRLPVSFQGGYRQWDWHASDVEADGRILMPAFLLHPDDGHVADSEGMVDITPLAGTGVRMVKHGVLRLLHVHSSGWPVFERMHRLERTEDGRRTWYRFDPATRMSEIYDAWEETFSEPASIKDFHFAKAVFRMGNPPPDRLPPPAVITAAAKTFDHDPVRPGELRHLMVVRHSHGRMLVDAVRAAREGPALGAPASTRLGSITEEEMDARVPFLAGLPNSRFDPEDLEHERFAGPDATSRSRLGRISTGFIVAAFFAYSKAPVLRSPAMLPRYLRSFDRFAAEAVAENPSLDLADGADLERAFEHVAFGELKAISGSRGWRDRMVQDAASVLRHARRTMLAFDPDRSKGVGAQAPAEQPDREAFLERMRVEYASDREEYGSTRTRYADRVKNAYDRVVDAAAHRILQIRTDGAEGRAAIDHLCSEAGRDLPYWDVNPEGPELSETGHPTGRQQTRRYRWWRIDDAWLSLERDRHWRQEPPPDVWRAEREAAGGDRVVVRDPPSAAVVAARPRFHGASFVCEFLEATVSEQPGTPSEPPLLATLAAHHALTDGGHLDVGQSELKQELRRRWRIGHKRAGRSGLMQFDPERTRLARLASRSIRTHRRVLVPHEEAEHALRLAAHGVDAIVQTWCRPSEFMQQVEYGDRWEDPAGTDAYGWMASRKLNRRDPVWLEHFFECDEAHYLESVDLLALTCRRCRLDEPAIVDPPVGLAWKLDPAPFVIAFDGRFVAQAELRDYLAMLLVNVSDARFHDLRAGASNRSRRKGAPTITLGEGLGHRSAGYIELYSSLTPEQMEEEAAGNRTAKIDRIEADNRRRDA